MTRTGAEITAPSTYVDFGHLTTEGSIHLIEALRSRIFQGIAPRQAPADRPALTASGA